LSRFFEIFQTTEVFLCNSIAMFAALLAQSLSSCSILYFTSSPVSLTSLTFEYCGDTAVQIDYAYCLASITDCRFSHCSASSSTSYGGGIYFRGLELIFSRCVFEYCRAQSGASAFAEALWAQPARRWQVSESLVTSCTT
jgi:hypothetical protein